MADEQQDEQPKDALIQPTVRLAKDAVPPTFSEEGKADVPINVGMEHTIWVPSLKKQQTGFTPYIFKDEKNKAEPVDATQELLAQFPGIYKPFK